MAASLWIAFGGALGSLARYWSGLALAVFSKSLPWGTIFINIGGSFLIAFAGALTVSSGRLPVSDNIRLFIMVGFCGGFTTFSAFSLQNFELLRNGAYGRAFVNMALSVILCLAATALGACWGEKLAGKPQQIAAQAKLNSASGGCESLTRSSREDEA